MWYYTCVVSRYVNIIAKIFLNAMQQYCNCSMTFLDELRYSARIHNSSILCASIPIHRQSLIIDWIVIVVTIEHYVLFVLSHSVGRVVFVVVIGCIYFICVIVAGSVPDNKLGNNCAISFPLDGHLVRIDQIQFRRRFERERKWKKVAKYMQAHTLTKTSCDSLRCENATYVQIPTTHEW